MFVLGVNVAKNGSSSGSWSLSRKWSRFAWSQSQDMTREACAGTGAGVCARRNYGLPEVGANIWRGALIWRGAWTGVGAKRNFGFPEFVPRYDVEPQPELEPESEPGETIVCLKPEPIDMTWSQSRNWSYFLLLSEAEGYKTKINVILLNKTSFPFQILHFICIVVRI